jgi:hypothetical protein
VKENSQEVEIQFPASFFILNASDGAIQGMVSSACGDSLKRAFGSTK